MGGGNGVTMEEDAYRQARERMVESQLRPRGIASKKVLDVMREMPRHAFVSVEERGVAYEDGALPRREGQTISQPFMVAVMTQELQLAPGHQVLELGTGTGYQTAILARLVPEGRVYTIERVASLTALAQKALLGLEITNVRYYVGDGTAGWPDEYWDQDGPVAFDRILVTAGAPEVPQPLVRQLRDGGALVVPVGPRDLQTRVRVERRGGQTIETRLLDCRFVPLVGEFGWRRNDE